MKASAFLIRIWRILSILGFVFSLFNSYVSYPGEVAVRFDPTGYAVQYVSRETLFYIAVLIFLLTNVLIGAVSRLFPRIPTERLPIPNAAVWAAHRPQLNIVVTNWFSALRSAVATILALGLAVLSFLNRSNHAPEERDYAWLLPLSTLILISVLVGLPIRLFMKPSTDA